MSDASPPRSRRRLPLIALVALAALAAAGWWAWRASGHGAPAPPYRLAKIERGNLTATVSASGTLSAVTTVLVGSQISGQIKEIHADFNSPVRKGQLLARIDPETYELKVRQAEADLEAARTSRLQRESDAAAQRSQLLRARIVQADAKRDLERKESLVQKGFISPAELDKARFTEESAAESIRTSEAQVRSADAQAANAAAVVKQRDAALASARNDLAKTAITAPVDGVVISRQVDAGQTVAASLNTPTLFTIAQDLREMQVEVAIDESDIGRIRLEQPATFTVDAFPGRTFEGHVRQIRKAAQVSQNVVTYIVVVGTQNPNLALVPGMTANVRIVTDSRSDVLKIANAALRWRPPGAAARDEAAPSAANAPVDAQARKQRLVETLKLDAAQQAKLDDIFAEQRRRFADIRELPEGDRRPRIERLRAEVRQRIGAMLTADQRAAYAEVIAEETGRLGSGAAGAGRIHLLRDGKPLEQRVRTGLTDGNATEISGADVREGDEVIVGTNAAAAAAKTPGAGPRMPF